MGLFKGIGKVVGKVVGGTVGGALEVAGTLTDTELLKKAGQGVHQVTSMSGEVLGSLVDATVTTTHGVITKDGEKVKEGLGDAGNAVVITAGAVGTAIKHTAVGTAKVIHDVLSDTSSDTAKTDAPDSEQQ